MCGLRRFVLSGLVLAMAGTSGVARSAPAPQIAAVPGGWRLAEPLPGPVEPAGAPAGPTAPNRSGNWTFSTNARTHPESTGNHLWPDIATAPNGDVAVAWMDDHASGGYHIFYTVSSDHGATWSTPEKIDTRISGGYSKFVNLGFTPSGKAVAVWEDDRSGGIQLYFSKREPGGWSANLRINTAGGPTDGSYFMNPSIAVLDEDRYFVAWTDWREGVYNQVYMRATRDGGATWGPEVRISDEIGYLPLAGDPCLIVDPASGAPGAEILYCVMNDWRGYAPGGRYPEVYFSRSVNGGSTWSNGIVVNDVHDMYQQVSSHALVRLSDGTLTAGWLSSNNVTPMFRTCVSTDQGATWSPSARVDDPLLQGTGTCSSIVGVGDEVFAGFDCYPAGSWDSYFRASSDGGRTWTDPVVRMDDDNTNSATGNTVIAAASPGQVYGAWQDNRPGGVWKIYAAAGTRSSAGIGGDSIGWSFSCVPNPSRAGGVVVFHLSPGAAGPAAIGIYDLSGRLVRSLVSGGAAEVRWDGSDERGRAISAGVFRAAPLDGHGRGLMLVRTR